MQGLQPHRPNMGPQSSDLYANHYIVANQSSVQSNSFPVKPLRAQTFSSLPLSFHFTFLQTSHLVCTHQKVKKDYWFPSLTDLLLHPKTFLLATMNRSIYIKSLLFALLCVTQAYWYFSVSCCFLPRTISLCWSLGSNFRCYTFEAGSYWLAAGISTPHKIILCRRFYSCCRLTCLEPVSYHSCYLSSFIQL